MVPSAARSNKGHVAILRRKTNLPMGSMVLALIFLATTANTYCSAFEYVLLDNDNDSSSNENKYSVRLVDVTTNTSDVFTLFRKANATVHVDGLAWQASPAYSKMANHDGNGAQQAQKILNTARLAYTTYLDHTIIATGSHDLSPPGTLPPSSVMAGYLELDQAGRHNVTVTLQVVYSYYNDQGDDKELEFPTSATNISDFDLYSTNYEDNNDISSVVSSLLISLEDYSTPMITTTRHYESFQGWVTILPVFFTIFMGWLTGNVEISISTTNLISVCVSHGSFFRGTEYLVQGCILGALANVFNGTVMLLVFFISGIMSLVRVTGGSKGFVKLMAYYIRSTRVVQCLFFAVSAAYFWDDVLSILLMGFLFRPLLDMAHTSKPVAAMILDATAGPIASIVVLSTWLSWEIPLLQQELDRLEGLSGGGDDAPILSMTPLEVLRESLPYAFYPIFLLILMPLLLWSQRHMGQMLMYERLTQVYQAKDGGARNTQGPTQEHLPILPNITCRFWNSCLPIGVISVLFVFNWFQTGVRNSPYYHAEENGGDVSDDYEWIASIFTYSSVSLAWMQCVSMGAALFVVSLILQRQENGSIYFLPCNIRKLMNRKKKNHDAQEDDLHFVDETEETEQGGTDPTNNNIDDSFRPLIPLMDLIGSFFFGFSHVMPFMIQFILAWALRDSFSQMGLDRWIASMFGNQLDQLIINHVQLVPTLAFLTAFFMSLFVGGAARGKVASVLLPMAVSPVYKATHATDPDMVFQVIGAILSGCVAGDHAAPLSNTTLLSCLSSDCHVLVHVVTQLPYICIVALLSLAVGVVPVGFGAYPVVAGYCIGIAFLLFFVFFLCCPILDINGGWDIFTRLYIRIFAQRKSENATSGGIDDGGSFWEILQRDTIRAARALADGTGISYDAEDFQYLMKPIESRAGSGEGHNLSSTSSSSSKSKNSNPTRSKNSMVDSKCASASRDSEDAATHILSVHIIANNGLASANEQIMPKNSRASTNGHMSNGSNRISANNSHVSTNDHMSSTSKRSSANNSRASTNDRTSNSKSRMSNMSNSKRVPSADSENPPIRPVQIIASNSFASKNDHMSNMSKSKSASYAASDSENPPAPSRPVQIIASNSRASKNDHMSNSKSVSYSASDSENPPAPSRPVQIVASTGVETTFSSHNMTISNSSRPSEDSSEKPASHNRPVRIIATNRASKNDYMSTSKSASYSASGSENPAPSRPVQIVEPTGVETSISNHNMTISNSSRPSEDSSEKPTSHNRPVRIIATNGLGLVSNQRIGK